MKYQKYRKYRIFIWFDFDEPIPTTKQFDVVAIDIDAALADIRNSHGEFLQYTYYQVSP